MVLKKFGFLHKRTATPQDRPKSCMLKVKIPFICSLQSFSNHGIEFGLVF